MTEQHSQNIVIDNDGEQFANFMQQQMNDSEKNQNLVLNPDLQNKDYQDQSYFDDNKSSKTQILKPSNTCLVCNKSYDNKSNLNRHFKRAHSQQSQNIDISKAKKSTSKAFHETISSKNQDINQQQQEDQSMIQDSEDSDEEIKEPKNKRQKTMTTSQNKTSAKVNQMPEESDEGVEDTITRIKHYKIQDIARVPVYQMLHNIATKPSPWLKMSGPPFGTMVHNYRLYKLYSIKGFLEDILDEIKLNNEYLITSTAQKLQLFGIMHLEEVHKGSDHIALQYINYNYPFTYYLSHLRDHDHDKAILKQVIYALRELHTLGYVHHRLGFENIVINQFPVKTKLINFEESKSIKSKLLIEYNGSLLFYPLAGIFKSGDTNVDLYALVSMIVLLFISKDYNIKMTSQSQLIEEAKTYYKRDGASPIIRDFIKIFYNQPSANNWYDLEEIEQKFDKLCWLPEYREIPRVPQLKRLI